MDFTSHSSCKIKFYIPGKNGWWKSKQWDPIFFCILFVWVQVCIIHLTRTISQETTNGFDAESIAARGELLWSFLFGSTQLLFFIAKNQVF